MSCGPAAWKWRWNSRFDFKSQPYTSWNPVQTNVPSEKAPPDHRCNLFLPFLMCRSTKHDLWLDEWNRTLVLYTADIRSSIPLHHLHVTHVLGRRWKVLCRITCTTTYSIPKAYIKPKRVGTNCKFEKIYHDSQASRRKGTGVNPRGYLASTAMYQCDLWTLWQIPHLSIPSKSISPSPNPANSSIQKKTKKKQQRKTSFSNAIPKDYVKAHRSLLLPRQSSITIRERPTEVWGVCGYHAGLAGGCVCLFFPSSYNSTYLPPFDSTLFLISSLQNRPTRSSPSNRSII